MIFGLLNLDADGVSVELADGAAVPLLVILMEVQRGVPQRGVHVDVLPHRLQHRVGGGVPVQVSLDKVVV